MFEPLQHVTAVNVSAHVPITEHVCEDHIAIIFGSGASEFEIGMDVYALQNLLGAAQRALAAIPADKLTSHDRCDNVRELSIPSRA